MSASALALSAVKERRRRMAIRERWDKRPEFYPADWPDPERAGKPFPKNVHRPKFGKLVEDLYGRNATLEDMVKGVTSAAKVHPRNPNIKLYEGSISDLARVAGNLPYSTAAYTARLMIARGFVQVYNVDAGGPAEPRRPGERHKTVLRILHYDEILQAMRDNPNVATPSDRTFYTINGRPISTLEAVLWGLDAALAEKMPEVWALNQRALDPDAPMKPFKRRPRKATADEIAQLLGVLQADQLPIDEKQTGRLIAMAWTVAPKMPVTALVELVREQMIRARKNGGKRLNLVWFSWNNLRGLASLWLNRRAAAAEQSRAEAENALPDAPEVSDGSGADPPPVITLPRKDFPS